MVLQGGCANAADVSRPTGILGSGWGMIEVSFCGGFVSLPQGGVAILVACNIETINFFLDCFGGRSLTSAVAIIAADTIAIAFTV